MTARLVDQTIDAISAEWPRVAPMLQRALDATPDQPESILDVYYCLTRDPHHRLWVADDAAMVTHLLPGRHGPTLHFWLAGGAMPGIRAIYPLAESFARSLGCQTMTLLGRPGWERSFLRGEGWTPSLVHLEKGLS